MLLLVTEIKLELSCKMTPVTIGWLPLIWLPGCDLPKQKILHFGDFARYQFSFRASINLITHCQHCSVCIIHVGFTSSKGIIDFGSLWDCLRQRMSESSSKVNSPWILSGVQSKAQAGVADSNVMQLLRTNAFYRLKSTGKPCCLNFNKLNPS